MGGEGDEIGDWGVECLCWEIEGWGAGEGKLKWPWQSQHAELDA